MEVFLVAVASLDGYITRHDEPGARFASPEDGRHFAQFLQTCDASVFGSGTWEADREPIAAGFTSSPDRLRYVLTRRPDHYAPETIPGTLEFSAETPAQAVASLTERGYQRCALLGGGAIYGAFMAADLVDELLLTVEPLVFGAGVRWGTVAVDKRYDLVEVAKLSANTLLLRYRRPGGVAGSTS
jgi:riboflavin biosynthesis pyrimidine reductase